VCDRADVGPVGVPVAGDATTPGELSDAALPRAGGGLTAAQKQNSQSRFTPKEIADAWLRYIDPPLPPEPWWLKFWRIVLQKPAPKRRTVQDVVWEEMEKRWNIKLDKGVVLKVPEMRSLEPPIK
jgi:hypothetical protein